MATSRKAYAGVVPPNINTARQRVNEQLNKIKEELCTDASIDDISESDTSFDYSQTIRPQRFYSDLDNKLETLSRDEYISELLRICHSDYFKINDYRDRLAERAQSFPNCPQAPLVNRRNSSTGTKEEKCAADCYVLYSFTHGVQNRDIHGVFANSTAINDTTTVIDDENPYSLPDVFGILSNIQTDITDIKKRQATDSVVLESVRTDVNQVAILFRTIHGSVNSVLSRVGTIANSLEQMTKLKEDCTKMETALVTLNKRFLDDRTNHNQHNHTESERQSSPTKNKHTTKDEVHQTTTTPTCTIAVTNKPPKHHTTANTDTEEEHTDHGFKAVRRSKTLSFFLGNIDIQVSKQDIYDFMLDKNVKPSLVNVYYGRNGAGAKINIHFEDEDTINQEDFWPPDITCRKWVNKQEWEKTKSSHRQNRPPRHQRWSPVDTEHEYHQPYDTNARQHHQRKHYNDRNHGHENRIDDDSRSYQQREYDAPRYHNNWNDNSWDRQSIDN